MRLKNLVSRDSKESQLDEVFSGSARWVVCANNVLVQRKMDSRGSVDCERS
jgi:hypothetical protein